MKISQRLFPTIALVAATILSGFFGCSPSPKSKNDLNDAKAQVSDGADTIYYGYGSDFVADSPDTPIVGTLHAGVTLATNPSLNESGTSIASVADRISFVIQCMAGAGLILKNVADTPLTETQECADGEKPFTLTQSGWEYPKPGDSTFVNATVTLESPHEQCDLSFLQLEGGVIVTLVEGMPDDPCTAIIKEVYAWKNGVAVPTKYIQQGD